MVLVVGMDSFRIIVKIYVDCLTILIVTYPVNNNALTSLFIARKTLNLSSSIVVIGHQFIIRISHRLHTVPAIIRSTIDISPDVCHARHDRSDSLNNFALSAVDA